MNRAQFNNWILTIPAERPPLVMGVLNVTPDSFSDGGQFTSADAALAAARSMAADGADLIDIGGESTRPGALPIPADEQIRRIVPAIEAIARDVPALAISVDTSRAAVARAALDAGATLINDIWAGRDDPEMLPLVAARGVPMILMHMQGSPETMQRDPHYSDVTAEVIAFLVERVEAAQRAGISREKILLDPGIGFGKSIAHNLELLRRLPEVTALGLPVVIGTSRKGFIGKVIGAADPLERTYGTAATISLALANGSAIVRVHDVKAMSQVVRMTDAILSGRLRT